MSYSKFHSSGSSRNHEYDETILTRRHNRDVDIGEDNMNEDIADIIDKTNQLNLKDSYIARNKGVIIRNFSLLTLTLLSAFVRLYRIHAQDKVVWDEAHFGKFGSYYLKHEFYFDVHPPLGKLLVGLSGYLAGYDGQFPFESGLQYTDSCNYVFMRCFNCIFGIICTPLIYKTCLLLEFSQWTTWFISLLVVFEMISLTLSKFILLDSMLLFFTVLSYYCLINLHNLRLKDELLTMKGIKWLTYTGLSIGCVCSVKWVGLFVTVLVGLYIVYDLMIKTYQVLSTDTLTTKNYFLHWASRIVTLIIIPVIIYASCFKIHFLLLNKSGPGDGSISTLLQASLEGNTIKYGPRSAAYGSLVTLRSQGLSPNLLHSHQHLYPEGSQQQQITTYGYKDENNNFLIEFGLEEYIEKKWLATEEPTDNSTLDPLMYTTIVKHGLTVRLVHEATGCLLHSHPIQAPVLKHHHEVSCYADLDDSDSKDEWIIEIQNNQKSPSPDFDSESEDELHPISTNFRLRHKVLGCYLATTGYALPSWGFQQGEVVCKNSLFPKDKSTWWNLEDHANDKLEQPSTEYIPPKPGFLKEFLLLNYGMMASNNALIPDPNKFDRLSSEWWEWPILHSGLRMCSWSVDDTKYFLIGNPVVTWFSTLSVGLLIILFAVILFKWRRERVKFEIFGTNWNSLLAQGLLPLFGWWFHFLPFIVMGRVKYIHHYVPALYFAIFLSGYILEVSVHRRLHPYISGVIYVCFYAMVIGAFIYLRDLSWGMDGSSKKYSHLKVLRTWMV